MLSTMICFRLLDSDDPATPLAEAVATLRRGEAAESVYAVNPESFRQVPNAPFAYWVSNEFKSVYKRLPTFESERLGRTTACGLGTTDNFRFLRLSWECPGDCGDWTVYFDGGKFSRFWDEYQLRVLWSNDGMQIKRLIEDKFGTASRKVQGATDYFRAGFVFPRRTRALAPKAIPSNGIFSNAGQAGFLKEIDLAWGIGLLGTSLVSFLISLSQGSAQGGAQFEVGLIKRIPWPNDVAEQTRGLLANAVHESIFLKRRLASSMPSSTAFFAPALRPTANSTSTTASDA